MAKSKSAASKIAVAGKLSIVATPIGNMEDITLRGLNALKNADIIVCEETKEANRLLSHYEIDKEVIELNEHNDTEMTVECMKMLSKGKSLALISDAGTPLLADPGDMLVKAAIKYNINVEVIPGASSILTALVRSGLPTSQFLYAGFLSRKADERNEQIKVLAKEKRTIILLDTPYRLPTVLTALAEILPDRQAYLGVNLTMTSEAHYYGTLSELSEHFGQGRFKNEYVIIIDGANVNTAPMDVVNPPIVNDFKIPTQSDNDTKVANTSKRGKNRHKEEELIVIPDMETDEDGPQPGNEALPVVNKVEFDEDDDSQPLYSLDEDEAFANFDPSAEDSGFGFDEESSEDLESDDDLDENLDENEDFDDFSDEEELTDEDEIVDEVDGSSISTNAKDKALSQRPTGGGYRSGSSRGRSSFRGGSSGGRSNNNGGGSSAGRYRDRDRDYRDRDYRGGAGGRDRDRDYRDRDYRGGAGGRDRDRDYRDRDYRGGVGGRDRDRDYRDRDYRDRDYRGGGGRDRDRDYRDRDYRDRESRNTRGGSVRGGFRDDKRDVRSDSRPETRPSSRPDSRGRGRDTRDDRPSGNRPNDDSRRTSIIYDSENFGNREEANYSIFDATDPRNNPRNKNKTTGNKRGW